MQQTPTAMGLPLEIEIIEEADSVRIELSGEGGEQLLRRRGEALDALQHSSTRRSGASSTTSGVSSSIASATARRKTRS